MASALVHLVTLGEDGALLAEVTLVGGDEANGGVAVSAVVPGGEGGYPRPSLLE